jgi:uncharacterized protein YjbJ (UPF0337 family)
MERASRESNWHQEKNMNTSTITGNWKEFKGKLKEQWGKLTDNDLAVIEGRTERLAGLLEKRYGWSKEEAEKNAENFFRDCGCGSGSC